MHTHFHQQNANLATAIKTAGATGLLVHISELDISLNPGSKDSVSITPAMTGIQAAKYAFIMREYLYSPQPNDSA